MSTLKVITPADIKPAQSFLNQLVDVIQEDISGSSTRKSYQVFVTGGVGPGVTSSMFQTIYDQDFTLQTANPLFDMSFGLYSGSTVVTGASIGLDTSGKALFPSTSLMMREKIFTYRQFAQLLLDDSNARFVTPFNSTNIQGKSDVPNVITPYDNMDDVLFLCFKRLFSRDRIKKETFAMKFFQSASHDPRNGDSKPGPEVVTHYLSPNLNVTSPSGSKIYTDVGSSGYSERAPGGGEMGMLVDSSDTSRNVGILFYEWGIAALDLRKIISGTEAVSGVISAMSPNSHNDWSAGQTVVGGESPSGNPPAGVNLQARFIPDLLVSASIDNILNHIATCRFGSSTNTAITFQNITNIYSTLIFCRATADEFNLSQNPTYRDSSGRIIVVDPGFEGEQKPFTFITSVCLYNSNNELMAVAKLSRPIEKNDEKDVTFRVRLDF